MNKVMNDNIQTCSKIISEEFGHTKPEVAIVLGSGLDKVANLISPKKEIAYKDLPGFPVTSVVGHSGSLVIGDINNKPVIFLKGRVHLYEGTNIDALKVLIRTIHSIGIKTFILTNAAGSLRTEYGPGSLVAISDHLNLTGTSPLVGPNDEDWGPRFPGMENAWDKDLREKLIEVANSQDTPLTTGVFAGWLGPSFETPAEIRMLKVLGADTVGMSMVAENIIARHCGLKCLGISAITNLACGLSPVPLSHEQTLAGAKLAEEKLAKLIREFVLAC